MASGLPNSRRQGRNGNKGVLDIFFAYAIVGFANVHLPCIILYCSYLIIPFPRGAVILIEALPALAAKALFPHLIHHVPYYLRAILIPLVWTICGIVTWATPPNVTPLFRVLIVMLATATAAVTDVWMLGMLSYYGRPGVAGWGVGTGLGYVTAAILPYVVTVHMGIFLRDTLDYLYFLVPLLMWGFVNMLRAPRSIQTPKPHEDDTEDEENHSLLIQEPPQPAQTFQVAVVQNVTKLSGVAKAWIQPLYSALLLQAFFSPGFYSASPKSQAFNSLFAYLTACGFAFHVGNLIGRSSILFKRTDVRLPFILSLQVLSGAMLVNTLFIFFSTPVLLLGLAAVAGVVAGAMYIQTIDKALQTTLRDTPSECEFLMGAISVGDALGLLIGGLTTSVVEAMLCENGWGWGDRWCTIAG